MTEFSRAVFGTFARAVPAKQRKRMPPRCSGCSTAKPTLIAIFLTLGASQFAHAAPGDCAQIDATAAAGILGVPAARANPNQGAHSKLPPDNMDLLSCGWFRSSATGDTFEGYIAMQNGANVVVVKIGGMPSSDTVKNALISAGKILAKRRPP